MTTRFAAAGALAVTALCSFAPLGTAAHAAQAGPGIGIRLLEAPADRRNDPRARTAIVDHLRPGAHIARRIEVVNMTPDRVQLLLYPVAASIEGGALRVGDGHTGNEATSWITVSPPSVDVAPGKSAQAVVDVTVPDDVEPGERYAVVVAELPAKPAAPGSVSIASRVGVRLYLSVGSGNEPRTDFVVTTLKAQRTKDGVPRVTAQVRNTGGRALDFTGELALANGPGGLTTKPYPVQKGTTLGVGATAEVVVDLDPAIPAGPWDATLTLRSGRVVRAVTGQIRFPDSAGATASPVPAKPKMTSGPPREAALATGGFLVLFVGTALLVFVARGRKRLRER